ncbi:MAG: transposase [Thermococcus sp.]|nr:transposase [Thermococcus sp.]
MVRKKGRQGFLKLHVLYDLESKTVVSLRVTEGSRHDSPVFRDLIGDVGRLECLLADSGYLARQNVQLVADKGGVPFIKLKKNVGRSSKPRGYPAWKDMVRFQLDHPRKFRRVYRFRVLIESFFSVFKSRFLDFVRCRLPASIFTEIFGKIILLNLIQVIKMQKT